MDFELSEEQRQLGDSLERLLAQQYGLEQRRAILSAASGGSASIWSRLAELGILSLPVSEAHGGFGGGATDLMRPMALLGHALVVEPVLAHLRAARLLDRCLTGLGDASSDENSARVSLQRAAEGELRLVWAHPCDDTGPTCTARSDGDGWRLDGRIDGVVGAIATPVAGGRSGNGAIVPPALVLISARSADDKRLLFSLEPGHDGLRVSTGVGLDHQAVADLSFDSVRLSATHRIGSDRTGEAIAAAIDDATDFESALLCAEAVGLIEFACATTLEYLKTRKQFGVPIGSFQALQHRIVDLHVELEQVRSMAALACSKVDAATSGQCSAADRTRAVAAARVLVGKAADKVAQESVQLHGGMGMADELKISHTFRRLTVLARQSGSTGHYLDRFIAANRHR